MAKETTPKLPLDLEKSRKTGHVLQNARVRRPHPCGETPPVEPFWTVKNSSPVQVRLKRPFLTHPAGCRSPVRKTRPTPPGGQQEVPEVHGSPHQQALHHPALHWPILIAQTRTQMVHRLNRPLRREPGGWHSRKRSSGTWPGRTAGHSPLTHSPTPRDPRNGNSEFGMDGVLPGSIRNRKKNTSRKKVRKSVWTLSDLRTLRSGGI